MNFGSLISFIIFAVLMSGTVGSPARETVASQRKKLPTGVDIDPVGRSTPLGSMPLAMILAPDGQHVVISLGGWREQGIQIVSLKTNKIEQTLLQDSAFVGLAFSADGQTLYVSGGNEDCIYRYNWSGNAASLKTRLILAQKEPGKTGSRYPAGLAVSRDGKFLYVAENVSDTLAVVDLATANVVQRLATHDYPYGIAVSPDDTVYVSAWGGDAISVFHREADGQLSAAGTISVGRHPSALLLDHSGAKLFAALGSMDETVMVDTHARKVIRHLSDAAPAGPHEGTTPNALALSPDESRLFVAEADANSVAVFDVTRRGETQTPLQPIGRIPTDWYPTGVLAGADRLLTLCAKGHGSGANVNGPKADRPIENRNGYTLGQLDGSLLAFAPILQLASPKLSELTRRVSAANRWHIGRQRGRYPPFKHVVYIIKENRTYDQVFGDVREGDGDPNLLFFGDDCTPNHRALARRFGLFDRFFTNAEVSSQGHLWSTAAYVTDYSEKTIPSLYAHKRAEIDEGETDEPANGFLWQAAAKSNLTFRDYGEWVNPPAAGKGMTPARPGLEPHICPAYPPFDLHIPDQQRADAWIAELQTFERTGEMPQLEIMHLPRDHTAGGKPDMPTPRACMADNDLALGRIIEALSRSSFWKDSVVFVVEDDAQDGPDHVDSHRSVLLTISPYNRPGTISRFVDTTHVIAAIEDILGLGHLSQYDYFSRPLTYIFSAEPDFKPYTALKPTQSLAEKNPPKGPGSTQSQGFDLSKPDSINDATFNEVLWSMLKSDGTPMPPSHHASATHLLRATE